MATRIKTADNVLEHQFGEEAVLLHLETEKYYSLNGTAVDMWRALAAAETLEGAVDSLLTTYDVERAQLEADLNGLVSALQEAGMITVETD
ncbi:MAG: PqqD family protein [bacterium]|nr:PqqD family protein [bacterium]